MLGQGIIACSDRIGSLKKFLLSIAATSNQPSTPTHNVNGVDDDATTNSDPSVIDSIASFIKSS